MNIGSFVWNVFNGVLRFGTIERTDLDASGWAHCSVLWHDDEVYNRAIDESSELDQTARDRMYRIDELNLVSIDHLAQSIAQHTQRK
mgnify:CR=1 FL=1